MVMSDIQRLTQIVTKFRDARDWKKFHNPKDVSISLVLEATEVMEHFQWKSEEEIEKYLSTNKEKIGEELSDVLYWVLLLSHDLKIDLLNALKRKIKLNEKKYPIYKSKGIHKKYNDL